MRALLARTAKHTRRRTRRTPGGADDSAAPLLTIELVDSSTDIAHRVTDEAFAAGRRDGGRYRALCGVLVLPASLTAPGRGHCPACERGIRRGPRGT